jgi:hypothetical protein
MDGGKLQKVPRKSEQYILVVNVTVKLRRMSIIL